MSGLIIEHEANDAPAAGNALVPLALAAGIHDLPAAVYHSDPALAPSLSNSIGHILLTRSPAHAKAAHPRLTPLDPDDDSEITSEQEEGTALHALILEGRDMMEVVAANDWRTKAAQEARQAARAAGRIPLLAKRAPSLHACAAAARAQLEQHLEAADCFTAGQAERTLLWEEATDHGPIWCRALVDWLPDDPNGWIDDLKTVAVTAEPGAWGRKMTTEGYATQAAFYRRGAMRLGMNPRGFRFVVVERDPPFGLSVCAATPALEAWADDQVQQMIDTWGACLHRDHWPAYPPHIAWIDAPPWALMQAEERKMRGEFAATGAADARARLEAGRNLVMKSGTPFA
ncbi:MAG: PD-(D/E)XK nuclease-like domain-containing protein [Roseomonas sp.]|nr:PD-(D/E)XK nuclease-like domain-containing protein [Roseomonas sp.]